MPRLTYRTSGVSHDKAEQFIRQIRPWMQKTHRSEVMRDPGRFGGLFKLKRYREPVLVSSADGIGTKLRYAFKANLHEAVGVDCVAMNVNDIVTFGAEPLFFLDYFATGSLQVRQHARLIKGIAKGCQEAGCALIGGELAQMPGFYTKGEYEAAGFCVGVVEKRKLITGKDVAKGDLIVGLGSSGFHSNGYSLIRKVYPERKISRGVAKKFLRPTRIYVKPLLALTRRFRLKAISHITGGGLFGRVFQGIPAKRHAVLFEGSWPIPKGFRDLQKKGRLGDQEMFTTFNMGIGMTIVASPKDVRPIQRLLRRYKIPSWVIGEVVN